MSQIRTSVIVDLIDRVTSPIQRTKSAIDNLGRLQSTVQQFGALNAKTTETATQLSLAQANVRRLRDQIAATQKPTAGLKREFERAREATRGLLVQHDRERNELEKLSGALQGAGLDTRNLARDQSRLQRETDQLNRRMRAMDGVRSMAGAVGAGVSKVGSASVAFGAGVLKWGGIAAGAATGVGYAFNRMFIQTAASFEKYNVQLEVLEGSSAKAKTSMDWVSQFAQKTPFDIDGVMQSFVKLRAFGMDPMNGTMQAIADQTSKLGGGQAEMEGIVLALGQAWTKQKLQGEEALQLIERGVPVWDLLSKATGKSTAELQKMSESGQLGRHAISLLIEEMGKSSAGAANKQMQTWNGMVSNVSDTWQRFVKQVAESGAFDALKQRLGGLLETFNRMTESGELTQFAKQVSDAVVTGLGIIEGLGKGIVTVFEIVAAVVKAIVQPIVLIFKTIGDGWDKIFGLVDKFGGTAIRDSIGKSVAALAAGLGSSEAGQAIETNQSAGYSPNLPVTAPRAAGKTDVGGTVRVVIDQQGKASVNSIKPNNPAVDYEIDRGLMMAH